MKQTSKQLNYFQVRPQGIEREKLKNISTQVLENSNLDYRVKSHINFIFCCLFICFSSAVLAQQTVTGTVYGSDGMEIPGASVIQKGPTNHTKCY